ncbi:MAG: hypothetical protein J0L53_18810 [Spirochaetes bacterium]|nr:hypothetical protein [Spirochaetota bacterium]
MIIYVASSWRNQLQPEIVEELRKLGHTVYDFKNPPGRTGFSWSEVDENWKKWDVETYKAALENSVAQAGFDSDFNAMKAADACVLVLPCGRSAHTEAGWMAGKGKKVYVFMQQLEEAELMYKIYDGILTSGDQLRDIFAQR